MSRRVVSSLFLCLASLAPRCQEFGGRSVSCGEIYEHGKSRHLDIFLLPRPRGGWKVTVAKTALRPPTNSIATPELLCSKMALSSPRGEREEAGSLGEACGRNWLAEPSRAEPRVLFRLSGPKAEAKLSRGLRGSGRRTLGRTLVAWPSARQPARWRAN